MAERSGFQAFVGQVTEGLGAFVDSSSSWRAQRLAVLGAIGLLAGGGRKFTTEHIAQTQEVFLPRCGCERGKISAGDEVSGVLDSLRAIGVVSYNPAFDKWRLSNAGRQAIGSVIGGDQ